MASRRAKKNPTRSELRAGSWVAKGWSMKPRNVGDQSSDQ